MITSGSNLADEVKFGIRVSCAAGAGSCGDRVLTVAKRGDPWSAPLLRAPVSKPQLRGRIVPEQANVSADGRKRTMSRLLHDRELIGSVQVRLSRKPRAEAVSRVLGSIEPDAGRGAFDDQAD